MCGPARSVPSERTSASWRARGVGEDGAGCDQAGLDKRAEGNARLVALAGGHLERHRDAGVTAAMRASAAAM